MGGETTPEQQYSLRWNDFHTSILSSFRHLRDEEDFVDVTLACDGCSFSAHKVVLSACSPYFRHLLKTNPCQHPIVILRDVQKKDMENLLRFMYNGEVHIGQDHLSDFLKTAKMLQVRGLAEVHTETSNQATLPSHSDSRSSSNTLSTLPITTEMQDLKEELSSPSPPPPSKKQKHNNDHDNSSPATETDRRSTTPVENATEMPESLLGQALEGGPTLVHSFGGHKQNADVSLQLQSADEEDSNSSDMDICDQKNALQQKMDASDYSLNMMDDQLINTNGTNASDQTRTPTFPGSILDLQGLLPGPSGLTNSVSSVENFGSRSQIEIQTYHQTTQSITTGSQSEVQLHKKITDQECTFESRLNQQQPQLSDRNQNQQLEQNSQLHNVSGSCVQISLNTAHNNQSLHVLMPPPPPPALLHTLTPPQLHQPSTSLSFLQRSPVSQASNIPSLPSLHSSSLPLSLPLPVQQHMSNVSQSLSRSNQPPTNVSLVQSYQTISSGSYSPIKLSAEEVAEIIQSKKNNADSTCPLCGRYYSTIGNLKQHLNNVHLEQQNRSVCEICGKSFKSKQYFITHLSQAHNLRKRLMNTFPNT